MDNQILRLGHKVSQEAVKIVYEGESLNEKRAEYVEVSGQLADLEEKKKDLVAELNEEIKSAKAKHKVLLGITRRGFEIKHMEVKLLANDDNGTVEFYDLGSGEYIGERNQYPNERNFITTKQEQY